MPENKDKTTTTSRPPLCEAPLGGEILTEVFNARQFTPDGKTETYFSADAELLMPQSSRWRTLRITVKHSGPVPVGMQRIVLDSFDLKKGEGTAHVCL